MQLTDAVVIDAVRRTRDGYLVGDARVARTGVQLYRAGELGLADRAPDAMVRVWRPEAEVFAAEALASFAHRPMTVDHPDELVTAESWRTHAVGQTGGEVVRDGDFIRVPLVLMDAAAIADFEAGRRELSAGYVCDLVWEAGETPAGEAYDAVQRAIRANHVALCLTARGGPELRLGDHKRKVGDRKMPKIANPAGEIARLKAELALRDAELGKKEAELEKLKAAQAAAEEDADPAAEGEGEEAADPNAEMESKVAERTSVIAKVKSIAFELEIDPAASNADLKRAAVGAKLGPAKVQDRSDDYVGALFDHLAADALGPDALRDAIRSGPHLAADARGAHAAYVKSLTEGWRGETAA